MENPKRARSWKRRLRPRVNLKNDVPVLYSTAGDHADDHDTQVIKLRSVTDSCDSSMGANGLLGEIQHRG